jgi:hypothetical protein
LRKRSRAATARTAFFRFDEGSIPSWARYFVTVRRAILIPWLRRRRISSWSESGFSPPSEEMISLIFSFTDLEAMSSSPPSRLSPELKKYFSSKMPCGV